MADYGGRKSLVIQAKGVHMLKLSEEQCAGVHKMEDEDFVRDTAQRLKRKFPGINEPDDTFHVRLRNALDYANTLPLKEKNVKRDFCSWKRSGLVFI